MDVVVERAESAMFRLVRTLGPGLLFAGAAIGVSHLVQSTRAGALYGLSLVWVILLAHLTKYPALSFGQRYTAATGATLLEAYRRQGPFTLGVFALLTIGTMFIVEAAILLVTGSIVNAAVLAPAFGEVGRLWGPVLVLAVTAIVLASGGFVWLDWLMKGLLVLMALLTALAVILVLPELDLARLPLFSSDAFVAADGEAAGGGGVALNLGGLVFLAALAGWMPAPIDIAVWNSLWAVAHETTIGRRTSRREASVDFNTGFVLCVLLALAFVILGAAVMHQRGIEPADGGGLANQIIELYTASIGPWARPLIAAAAIGVMFSTTITVFDAYPRVLVVLVDRFRGPEDPSVRGRDLARTSGYWCSFVVLAAGTLVIAGPLVTTLAGLVDLATTLTFITAPILAWFNHRAMFGRDVPAAEMPGTGMRVFSLACVWALLAMAAAFLWIFFAARAA